MLEAQLLSNYIDVTLTGRLAISSISPLLGDQFGSSLRFCYLEFDKEAIFDRCSSENPVAYLL